MNRNEARECNRDVAQRELDRRNAEGEDVSHLCVHPRTGEIVPTAWVETERANARQRRAAFANRQSVGYVDMAAPYRGTDGGRYREDDEGHEHEPIANCDDHGTGEGRYHGRM